jgi:hypothetical protein
MSDHSGIVGIPLPIELLSWRWGMKAIKPQLFVSPIGNPSKEITGSGSRPTNALWNGSTCAIRKIRRRHSSVRWVVYPFAESMQLPTEERIDAHMGLPTRAARTLVVKRFTWHYNYVLATVKDVPYSRWCDCNPEDTVQFYAQRLRDAGTIKSSP